MLALQLESQEKKSLLFLCVFLHLQVPAPLPCLPSPLGPKHVVHTAPPNDAAVRQSTCAVPCVPVFWTMTRLFFLFLLHLHQHGMGRLHKLSSLS